MLLNYDEKFHLVNIKKRYFAEEYKKKICRDKNPIKKEKKNKVTHLKYRLFPKNKGKYNLLNNDEQFNT